MAIERFISTTKELAGSAWVKPPHVANAIAEARRKKKFLQERSSRAFCATGDGGGIDNSCGSGEKMSPDSGGGSGGARGKSVTVADTLKLLQKISENPDGFTLDPDSAEQPPDGIMVSEYANDSKRSLRLRADLLNTSEGAIAFGKWLAQNEDLLAGDPTKFVGGWKDGPDFYIDVATRFEPTEAAEALEAGRRAGQLAVFNLSTFKTTWVKYEDGDSRKPKEWDKGFQRARVAAISDQVYDKSSPDFSEADWEKELLDHGTSTVRAYNAHGQETRRSSRRNGRRSEEVRRTNEADAHRDVPGVPGVPREVEWPPTGGGVVRRRSRQDAVPVQGSAAGHGQELTVNSRRLVDGVAGVISSGSGGPSVEFRSGMSLSVASYSPDCDTIFVSSDVSDDDVREFRSSYERGLVSQPNPVLSEYAKRHIRLACPGIFSHLDSVSLTRQQADIASRSVSAFAATSAAAFLVEYIAGRLSGQAYSGPVKELVREFTDGAVTL